MNQLQTETRKLLRDRIKNRIPSGLSIFSVLMLMCALNSTGCSLQFWRSQADDDSYRALNIAETDPRWVNPRKGLTPDPRSRFFDPYDPDKEPLPPDDPAAEVYMENVSGIPGYKSWHKLGRSFSIENPGWLSQFELTPEELNEESGECIAALPVINNLTIKDAVELSYIHDREYQFELEDTYLAALALTLEQFRFQVRYLGIGNREPGGTTTFTSVPGVSNSLRSSNRFGVSQLLPTGGQWALELANNTLWIFSGANAGTTSASTLSYRLTQPLLLNAGRKIALEDLTQAERSLLYNVRSLARFRKQLFVNTAGGGYLGLLTQIQGIRNREFTITQLERQVRELRAVASKPPGMTDTDLKNLPAGIVIPDELALKLRYDQPREKLYWFGAMSQQQALALTAISDDIAWKRCTRELIQILRTEATPLDVAQLESRLATAKIALRSAEQRFKDRLDQFKIQLGLPPDLVMNIDDASLNQFQLISPTLEKLRIQSDTLVEQVGLLDEHNPDLQFAKQVLKQLQDYSSKIAEQGIKLVEKDAVRVQENMGKRLAGISSKQAQQKIINTVKRDQEKLQVLIGGLQIQNQFLGDISVQLEAKPNNKEQYKELITSLGKSRQNLLQLVQTLQVIQVGFRSELIGINRFTLGQHDSVGVALENRLDLMNERANVTDARREQEVVANRLKTVLDVVVEGDIRTPPGKAQPLNFSGSSSSHRVGIQFTAPIDQVAERNNYRIAQIRFQRARRDYMSAEDQIKLQVRTSWRQLEVLEQNLETARQALRINVLQYDQAVEELNAPGTQSQGGVRGRNLIDALNDILDAQDQLIQIWADYERGRLNIHRDMGMMEIDSQGLWVDPYYQNSSTPPQEPTHEHDNSTSQGPAFILSRATDSAGYKTISNQAESTEKPGRFRIGNIESAKLAATSPEKEKKQALADPFDRTIPALPRDLFDGVNDQWRKTE